MTGLLRALVFSLALAATTGIPASAQTPCGMRSKDWCPAPHGDACGRHHNAAECRADPACYGMPYQGESVVACTYDTRGFASNCPTVGCTSVPPRSSAQ